MIAALSDWPYAAGGAIVGLVLLGLVGTVIDIWIERRDARLLGGGLGFRIEPVG